MTGCQNKSVISVGDWDILPGLVQITHLNSKVSKVNGIHSPHHAPRQAEPLEPVLKTEVKQVIQMAENSQPKFGKTDPGHVPLCQWSQKKGHVASTCFELEKLKKRQTQSEQNSGQNSGKQKQKFQGHRNKNNQ